MNRKRTFLRTPALIVALLALMLTALPGGARAQDAPTGGTVALSIWLCAQPTTDPSNDCQPSETLNGEIAIHGPVELSTDAAAIHGASWVLGEEEALPFGNYYLDPRGFTAPTGYQINDVVGTLGGSEIGRLFVLDAANPNAHLAMTLVPLGYGSPDTDGDSLNDVKEGDFGTDPNDPDTDGDGLTDGDEVGAQSDGYGTDPTLFDTDEDGAGDGDEIAAGTDPTDPNSVPGDDEPILDSDGDGLSDEREGAFGTDPAKADTDGDGLTDGEEILEYDTDALKIDTDFDGYSDGVEVDAGTDPLYAASVPADAEEASLTVIARICPDDAADQIKEFYCTGPVGSVPVELDGPISASTETDDSGDALIEGLTAGDYLLTLGVPGDAAAFEASCGVGLNEAWSPRTASTSNQIEVPVESAGEALTCYWFVFPADAGAETDPDHGDPTDGADPVDTTDPGNDDVSAPAPAPAAPVAQPAKATTAPVAQAAQATTSQSVTSLPNTGSGSAAGTLNGEGTALVLVALGTAIVAGLAGTRKLGRQRGA